MSASKPLGEFGGASQSTLFLGRVALVSREDHSVMEYALRIGQSTRTQGAVWPKVPVDDSYLSEFAPRAFPILHSLATGPRRFASLGIGLPLAGDHLQ